MGVEDVSARSDGVRPRVSSASPESLWPSLSEAGRMLRVRAGSLSRRGGSEDRLGDEPRLSPTTVLGLGRHYGRRDLGELGGELLAHAESQTCKSEELLLFEEDIEHYFTTPRVRADAEWLVEAEQKLEPEVFACILRAVGTGERVESFRGARFDEADEG